jgi:hypothetical protein
LIFAGRDNEVYLPQFIGLKDLISDSSFDGILKGYSAAFLLK